MKHLKLLADPSWLSLLDTKLESTLFMGLSKELILEILFRLPVKSLGRCKLVSKFFNSVISDPYFVINHLKFSSKIKPPLTIGLKTNNAISRLEFNDCKDITKGVRLVEFEHQIPESMSDDYDCFIIGSSNGLVCMYLMATWLWGDNVMFIWNPVTSECEEIALPGESGSVNMNIRSCWFGYLPSIDDYKIILSYNVERNWNFSSRLYRYSFKTSKWRKFRVTGEVCSGFASGFSTVFVNEALHCLGAGRSIFKFDLVKETFMKIPASVGELDFLKKCRDIELGIGKDGCLCKVFVQYHSFVNQDSEEEEEEEEEEVVEEEEDPKEKEKVTMEVWMLKDYGNLNSWEKWCRIELKGEIFRDSMNFLGFMYNGFICFRGKDGLVIIDPKNDPPSYVIAPNVGKETVHNMSNFMESLIAPSYLVTSAHLKRA